MKAALSGFPQKAVNNVVFDGNKSKNGGAISVRGGSVEMTNCSIENCAAKEKGGGLFIDENSTADLKNCTFESNRAFDNGGGIANSGKLTVTDCEVKNNTVYNNTGAGIWSNGDAVISGTTVHQNTEASYGGGIANLKNMTISGCTIKGNNAYSLGGGLISLFDSNTILEDGNVIQENTANNGAGIYLNKGKLSITDASIFNNISKDAGGGIWANTGTELALKNVKIQGNSCATNGGGINSQGTVSLVNCNINSNSADKFGGGIYMDTPSTLTVDNSSITFCQAKREGGGVYFHSGSLVLAGGKIRIADSNTNGRISNLYQREFKNIQVTGRLSSGSEIGFRLPVDTENRDITTGYGQYNEVAPSVYFRCDTNEFTVNKEEGVKEANVLQGLRGTNTSYKIRIEINVTDEADPHVWRCAYLHIYGRANKGKGNQVKLKSTPEFSDYIDELGDHYIYEYDCGADNFPTAVNFVTKFGDIGRRDFEGDIKIYINEVNVVSTHARHVVWECEEKNTWIDITGDKYPYPDPDAFEVDVPDGDIEGSGTITVSALDQYGLIWKADANNTSMKSITFPNEDTFSMADNTGFKWKLSSTHNNNHWSTYQLIFKSGSNVYPEIIKSITVRFIFPLHVRVVVDGKEVFDKTLEKEKETVQIRGIESIPGYYISGYNKEGTGEVITVGNNSADVDVTPINQSVTLTATLKSINYILVYDGNGTLGNNNKYTDIKNSMRKRTLYYGNSFVLDAAKFTRTGYTFAGWNTQPDGKGTMFKDRDTVKNLTTEKGSKVTLYAIWKPNDGVTTASIFSDGTVLVYVGAGILILSIVAAVIYSKRKKRKSVQTDNQ